MPVIDRKFIISAVNPVTGKRYSNASALLLCAKDKAVPATLLAYAEECRQLGCSDEHIESVYLLRERVLAYQSSVENHVPDTAGDEVPRCLRGEGMDDIPPAEAGCVWSQQAEGYDTFSTDCGHEWHLDSGAPSDNEMKFCPFCGLALHEELCGKPSKSGPTAHPLQTP